MCHEELSKVFHEGGFLSDSQDRSQDFHSQVINSLPSQIAVLDGEGVIIHVNSAWLRFGAENGATEAQRIGIGVNYLHVCADAIGQWSEGARECREGLQAILVGWSMHFELEYPCHSKESKRWFLLWAAPLSSGKGLVLSHSQITSRKLAEEALMESEERYRKLVELSPYAIVVHVNRKWRYLNPAGTALLGASSSDELIGHSIYKSIDPNHHLTVEERLRRIEATRTASARQDIRMIRLDGAFVTIDTVGVDFIYDGQEAILAILSDVTQYKRAQKHLREAEVARRVAEEANLEFSNRFAGS
jgi:PAS domain S-box-containing protein